MGMVPENGKRENPRETILVLADWCAGGHNALYLRLIVEVLADAVDRFEIFSPLGTVVSASLAESANDLASRCRFHDFRKARRLRVPCPARFQGQAAGFSAGRSLARRIGRLERKGARTVVFFPCLLDWEAFYIRWFFRGFRRNARALLVAADFLRKEDASPDLARTLKRSRLDGIATLDEFRVDRLAALFGAGKRVAWLPDLSDTVSREAGRITGELERRSRGRPVVLAIGKLAAKKGLLRLLDWAEADREGKILFAMVGKWFPGTFPEGDRRRFEEARDRDNVFFYPEEVPTEGEYNELVRRAGFLYLGYPAFSGSSNNLTKAGVFGTPVLVEDGFLLADRVRRHGLGEVFDPDASPEEMIARIGELADCQRSPNPAFAEEVLPAAFGRRLAEFLQL